MGLLSRLCQPAEGETKLPIHGFEALIREYVRGEVDGATIVQVLDLDQTAQNNLTALLTKIAQEELTPEAVNDRLILGELGFYDLATVASKLGF